MNQHFRHQYGVSPVLIKYKFFSKNLHYCMQKEKEKLKIKNSKINNDETILFTCPNFMGVTASTIL